MIIDMAFFAHSSYFIVQEEIMALLLPKLPFMHMYNIPTLATLFLEVP